MQQEVLWFQLCLLLWEARDKVRRDPHSGMCPSHPPSHQLLGSCKIHHFPSTHAGGNNDNKNKIRMTPFPRQGGAERERALGNGLDFTASPGKRDFSERKSPPRACPLCLQKQGPLSAFPLSLDLVRGVVVLPLSSCKSSRFVIPAAGSVFPDSLASFKENLQSSNNVELEIFSSYLVLHYCDCFLLIDRPAFANTQDPWRIARDKYNPALACVCMLCPTELGGATSTPASETQLPWRDGGKIGSWFLCRAV